MERGRWYPTIVPLLDGRSVVMAGVVGFDPNYPSQYFFENNNFIEFFDPQVFATATDKQTAWRKVNVKSTPKGPFTNLINPDFKPTPGVNCSAGCINDNRYDSIKLYEQAYLTAEKRIYLTREGDGTRETKATYYMHIGGTRSDPTVSFSSGPPRAEEITTYGTTFTDPNSGRIALIGGQPTSIGIQLYQDNTIQGNKD
jgi:hypothetical protein